MEARNSQAYIHGPIGQTMLKTAAAMLAGTIAISGYNIADTYFVAKLGTTPLAAMGFTFPVVMLVGCLFHGLGAGVMITVAQALGGNKHRKSAGLLTGGLILIVLCSTAIAITGLLSLEWCFRQFGAQESVMPAIRGYMAIWYLGCVTGALTTAGNSLLIAVGDAKTASWMMLLGLALNVVLDPWMIFGAWPFPAMGIAGAALATVISQLIAATTVLWILHRKHRMLTLSVFRDGRLGRTWRLIIRFAVPSILGMLLMPIGSGVITRIVASFGEDAVAATAAAGRLEVIAFVFPMALGMALLPMVGQNYGARCYDRINQCRRFAMRFAFYFELGMAFVFFFGAPYLVRLFSSDPEVLPIMELYLRIIPFGFGMVEIHRYSGFFFTGCGRPAAAAWLQALRVVGLLIPLSWLALYFNTLTGVFWARLLADLIAGSIACYAVRRMTRNLPETPLRPLPVQSAPALKAEAELLE